MFVLMICRPSSDIGHVCSKTRSLEKENIVNTVQAALFASAVLNKVRMFILMIYRPSLNMGHAGSKTRLLGQIEGKSC